MQMNLGKKVVAKPITSTSHRETIREEEEMLPPYSSWESPPRWRKAPYASGRKDGTTGLGSSSAAARTSPSTAHSPHRKCLLYSAVGVLNTRFLSQQLLELLEAGRAMGVHRNGGNTREQRGILLHTHTTVLRAQAWRPAGLGIHVTPPLSC